MLTYFSELRLCSAPNEFGEKIKKTYFSREFLANNLFATSKRNK